MAFAFRKMHACNNIPLIRGFFFQLRHVQTYKTVLYGMNNEALGSRRMEATPHTVLYVRYRTVCHLDRHCFSPSFSSKHQ